MLFRSPPLILLKLERFYLAIIIIILIQILALNLEDNENYLLYPLYVTDIEIHFYFFIIR